MAYFIKKTETINFRPTWLKNLLFNDFTPSLLDSCSTLEAASRNLSDIYNRFQKSKYLKPKSSFENQELGFVLLSKTNHPVIKFQIMSE